MKSYFRGVTLLFAWAWLVLQPVASVCGASDPAAPFVECAKAELRKSGSCANCPELFSTTRVMRYMYYRTNYEGISTADPIQCGMPGHTIRVGKKIGSNEQVCIKWYSLKKLSNPMELEGLEILLRISGKHPGILKPDIYWCHHPDRGLSLVMFTEFCQRGNLENILNAKSQLGQLFTNKRIHDWMKEIMSALAYLHSNDIFHRDLKPSNLVVDSKGKIKIIDFDFAIQCVPEDAYSPGRIWNCGSPAWISPEFAKSLLSNVQPRVDEQPLDKKDTWAIGMILYSLLFNNFRIPKLDQLQDTELYEIIRDFEALTMEELRQKFSKIRRPFDEKLANLLIKLLEPNPKDRWSAKESLADLESADHH